MALIGTNKTEALAVNLILHHKIKFTAKYSFVFIRVISGQISPVLPSHLFAFALNRPRFSTFIFCLLSFIFHLVALFFLLLVILSIVIELSYYK